MPRNSSGPQSRKQLRSARKARSEAMRQQARRRQRRQNLLVIGGSVVTAAVVLALVGVSIARRGGGPNPYAAESISPSAPTGTPVTASGGTLDTSTKASIKGVQFWSGLADKQVTSPVTYPHVPPVGGPYNPVWLNCGIYNDAVPDEYAVADLAHGAVWITYQPALDTAGRNALITLSKSYKGYVTLSPDTKQTSKVVATAWGTQLSVSSATDPRLAAFLKTYRNSARAPQPHGKCTGGTGEPRGTVQAGDIAPTLPTSPSAPASPSATAASPTASPSATAASPTASPTGR